MITLYFDSCGMSGRLSNCDFFDWCETWSGESLNSLLIGQWMQFTFFQKLCYNNEKVIEKPYNSLATIFRVYELKEPAYASVLRFLNFTENRDCSDSITS
jgi:hypothetical protein